jgi:hypothetical protein
MRSSRPKLAVSLRSGGPIRAVQDGGPAGGKSAGSSRIPRVRKPLVTTPNEGNTDLRRQRRRCRGGTPCERPIRKSCPLVRNSPISRTDIGQIVLRRDRMSARSANGPHSSVAHLLRDAFPLDITRCSAGNGDPAVFVLRHHFAAGQLHDYFRPPPHRHSMGIVANATAAHLANERLDASLSRSPGPRSLDLDSPRRAPSDATGIRH